MEVIKSRGFKIAAAFVGVLILMLGSFATGIFVGLHKARFSYSWGENYERNFLGSRQGPGPGMMGGRGPMMGGFLPNPGNMMRQFEGRGFRNAHGLAGSILSISGNNLVVKDRDNKENTVAVTDQTIIKRGQDTLKLADLKANDQVVLMGNPGDNGVLNATLIRVFNNPTN